jgi:hypothetical protein
MNLFMESALRSELRYFIMTTRFYTASADYGLMPAIDPKRSVVTVGFAALTFALRLEIVDDVGAMRQSAP